MKFWTFLVLTFIAHLSALAQDQVSNSFAFSAKGQCDKAIEAAKQSENPLLLKIITTRSILDSKCSIIDFDYALDFIKANPTWPQNNSIKNQIEYLINSSTKPGKVAEWFVGSPPKTPAGFKYYAFANQDSQSTQIAKQSWQQGEFSLKEQEQFLKTYGHLLNYSDHLERMANLVFSKRSQEAQDMLSFLSAKDKKLAAIQIALLNKQENAEKLFHSLNKTQKHTPGILYTFLTYKKEQKRDVTHEELALSMHIPQDPKRADKWWDLRSYYAREFLKLHRYREAYKLANDHEGSDRLHVTQAQWLAGWISLRFLNKPSIALPHFKAIYNNSSRAITLARGAYWTARSYKEMRKTKEANQWFEVAAKHGHTFYGQMAQYELGYKKLKIQQPVELTNGDIKNVERFEGPKIIELLIKYNQNHLAMAYLKNLFSISKDPLYVAYCMDLLNPVKDISFKVHAAREAAFYGVMRFDFGYPTPFTIQKPLLEPALIYSIIRQESSFDQNAIDVTDGRGLMQLLPSTAAKMAKSLGVKYDVAALFSDKNYNILLGSKHLADHIKYYNGSYLLGIPAYNAGAHRVDKWIKQQGDPRKIRNLYQILDWIEKIPFVTTRDYVHRILENLQIYRYMINNNNDLQITKDLTRKHIK